MEVKLLKELSNYSESIFFGLSLRQCIFALLAVGGSVAVYFIFHDVLPGEIVGWLCIVAALPGAALGFFKYQGLTAAQFISVFLRFLFAPTKLPRVNTNVYYEMMKGREK